MVGERERLASYLRTISPRPGHDILGPFAELGCAFEGELLVAARSGDGVESGNRN